jgi:hypothetical protein
MNERQRPSARPAFGDAADEMEAWRQQQIAALSESQRAVYEHVCRKADQREQAQAAALEDRKQADIRERMRKKLLEAPRLELEFKNTHKTLTETLADRLIAEYFEPGPSRTDLPQFRRMVQQAAKAARREIEREHAQAQQAFQDAERQRRDDVLVKFENARKARNEPVRHFARAGAKEKAKTDFEKAVKDDAIARAMDKVDKRESDNGNENEPDRDKGRDRDR